MQMCNVDIDTFQKKLDDSILAFAVGKDTWFLLETPTRFIKDTLGFVTFHIVHTYVNTKGEVKWGKGIN